MSSSRRTYDTDNITLRTVFAKNPGNVNVPALRVLTADGTGSCYWAIPSSLGQNPSFNEIITTAGTYTADLSYNKFRLLAGENIGMVNGAPGSNQTTLFGKAFSQIDISGDNTVYAFWENQLHSAFKIAGEGGIQVSADPTTQTIFINGPSGVINVSTGIYGFNQVKVTPTTSTITSNILNYGGDFITATSPSSLLRFLGYNDIILSTNVTRDAVFFTISTFTSQDYLAISNAAYAAYPSTLSTVSSLYVQQTLFNSTVEYLSSYSGFGFSSVVSSINALAMSTGQNFFTLSGLINANAVAIGNLSNAVAQTNLNIISTVAGLGSAGYLSTAGGGSGDVTSAQLKSTVVGLGTSGYLSTGGQGLFSTVYINLQPQDAPAWNSNVPSLGFDPQPNPLALDIYGSARVLKDLYVGSTTTIIGTGGVSSSNILTNAVSSGTSVVSSLGLINPADGQTLFLQVVGGSLQFNNTPVGSGVSGLLSTPNLASTVAGLGLIYPSTLSMMSSINASVSSLSTALGAVGGGNLTTTNLISTVAGLGQLYPSTLSMMSSINASMSSFSTAIGPIAAGGVTQIVAGTNISISPLGGTGIVTINASGGTGVTSDNLNSTITGLGLIYPSTLSMMSSINASVSSFSTALGPVGGGGNLVTDNLTSTVRGLGLIYPSTLSMMSSINANISSFSTFIGRNINGSNATFSSFTASNAVISSLVTSTVTGTNGTFSNLTVSTLTFNTGDGFIDFPDIRALSLSTFLINVSSVNVGSVLSTQSLLVSSINGGSLLSGTSLFSTVAGLGQTYVSTPSLVSTTVAFQTAGFLSSPTLFSTVTGLGQIYVSTLSTVNVLSSLLVNTSSLNAFYGNISSLTTSSMTAVNVAPSPVDLWVAVGSSSSSTERIQYSLDGSNWSGYLSGGGFFNSGYGIAWNGKLWVAAGDNGSPTGSLKYSTDGLNWLNNTSGGFTQSGRYVAWNGRIWIAVGENGGASGSIQYSTDGLNWTNSTNGGFTNGGFGVAWNGRIWVAVGDNGGTGNIQYSLDGLNWSNSSAASLNGSAVAWNGRLWVAVGTGLTAAASIQYSYDGINWSNFISGTGFDNGGAGVAWNGQMWVAVGGDQVSARSIKYSYDGLNWLDSVSGGFPIVSGPDVAYGDAIAWNGKLWVAGGAQNAANTESLKYSFDGMNWTNSSTGGFTTGCFTVAYSADPVPAYKQANFEIEPQNIPSFLTSTNQISFTASTIALNNTLFVDQFTNKVGINIGTPATELDIVGTARASIFSTLVLNASSINSPGLNFSNISSLQVVASSIRAAVISTQNINLSTINGQAFGAPINSTVRGLGSSGYVSTLSTVNVVSSLLVNASSIISPFISTIRFDATSTNSIYANVSSLNTSSLTLVNIAPSSRSLWVAVGTGTNNILISANGISWSPSGINGGGTGGFTTGRGVAWNGILWVAVGAAGSTASSIQYSSDGFNWINSSSGGFSGTNGGYAVAWNGRLWVAVGIMNPASATGSIKYSSDGINWTNNSSGGFTGSTGGRGIAWNGRIWVAVGDMGGSGAAGSIQYSINGINWINANTTFTTIGRGVAWNGLMWVAVGNNGGSSAAGSIRYSYDGINWFNANSTFATSGNAVAWNGRYWVAVGDNAGTALGSIRFSLDGINWTNNSTGGFAGFSSVGGGNTIAWNGSLWVAGGDNGISPGALQYSVDGINWTVSSGSIFSGEGNGVAFSYNPTPSYNQTNFEILPQNIPVFLRSTNQLAFTTSSIIVNNTLFVDGALERVGINTGIPEVELDVNGTGRALVISTLLLNASSITSPGLNLSNISSLQVVASSIRAPVMSTQQLNASSITAPVISSLRTNASSMTTFALSASTITSVSSMSFGVGSGWLVMGAVQAAVVSTIQQNTALSYVSSLYVGSTTTAVTNYTAYLNGNVLASTLMIGNPITNFSTQGFRLALTHDSALKPFTTAWNTVSDKRVKENIRDADIDRCYEDIKALPLRRFTWQENIFNSYSGTDRNVIGFIAQEVSTIIPKSVNVMEAYGYQDFQFLNIDQINMSFYGALKRTIQDKEFMDSTIKGQRVEIETLKGTTTMILSTLEGLQGR